MKKIRYKLKLEFLNYSKISEQRIPRDSGICCKISGKIIRIYRCEGLETCSLNRGGRYLEGSVMEVLLYCKNFTLLFFLEKNKCI